ncbi:hypothetical protein F4780DRAFT_610308 [Xylariomycetidae sp. FL0641]|nr:hypothetical protein F4780DRAFT_610308 [Xylariomycetidae sp. FL0641]
MPPSDNRAKAIGPKRPKDAPSLPNGKTSICASKPKTMIDKSKFYELFKRGIQRKHEEIRPNIGAVLAEGCDVDLSKRFETLFGRPTRTAAHTKATTPSSSSSSSSSQSKGATTSTHGNGSAPGTSAPRHASDSTSASSHAKGSTGGRRHRPDLLQVPQQYADEEDDGPPPRCPGCRWDLLRHPQNGPDVPTVAVTDPAGEVRYPKDHTYYPDEAFDDEDSDDYDDDDDDEWE